MPVLDVGGLETEREAEGPIGGRAVEEFQSLIAHPCGQMNLLAVSAVKVHVLSRPALVVVEQIPRRLAHAPLADKPGVVPGPLQQRGIGLGELPRREAGAEIDDSMPGGVLAREDARAIRHADRRGNEAVLKDHALLGQPIDVGRTDDIVAHAAQRVPPLVIGQQEDDIRPLRLGGVTSGGPCLLEGNQPKHNSADWHQG